MKKWWLLSALAILLAACGNDEEAKPAEDEDISVDVIEPEEEPAEPEVTEPEESETVPEEAPAEDPAISSDSSNSSLDGYEEAELLAEHIPVDELTAQVEADNQGKRVILFENESGQKVYKSIYIKHDDHVKIIDLNGDQLVYEGKL